VAQAVRDRNGEHARDLNLLQSIVDNGVELEKFDTAGASEEYGNVREAVAHHHDFDSDGGLVLHERSPINPKSVYATAKVAADFPTTTRSECRAS
jgi:dTDP-glucose 4,6-dehydratase